MRRESRRVLSRGGRESDLLFAFADLLVCEPQGITGGQRGHRDPSGEADASPGLDEAGGSGGGEKVKFELYFEGRTNRTCKWLDGEGGVVRGKSPK